jgi:hypothetical protein
MIKPLYQRKTILQLLPTFALVLLLGGTSCRVSLLPSYDAALATQMETTAKSVDRFYLGILETTKNENGERAYAKYAPEYVNLETDITALLNKNRIRPLNSNTVKICEITLAKFIKYKEAHKKDNTMSDGIIKLNRQYMGDLFYAMQVAENAKKIIDTEAASGGSN